MTCVKKSRSGQVNKFAVFQDFPKDHGGVYSVLVGIFCIEWDARSFSKGVENSRVVTVDMNSDEWYNVIKQGKL